MTSSNKIVIVKILNEVRCAVIGLRTEEYKVLFEEFGRYVKGYHFSPLFKLKKWDGKIRFFGNAGMTYIHLLPDILPILRNMGYAIDLVDKRTAPLFEIPNIDASYYAHKGVTLGEHQVLAINAASDFGNGIIVGGTGSGKTIMTALLCDLLTKYNNAKTIIIVPNIDLITQTRLELEAFDIQVGEYSGSDKDIDGDAVVSTWQALQYNPGILSQFNALIVDEAHLVTGKVLAAILGDPAAHISFRIALTGTLQKDPTDRMQMKLLLGSVLYEIPAKDLIKSGWLAELDIKMRCLIENLEPEYNTHLASPEFKKYMQTVPNAKKPTLKNFIDTYLPDYDSEKNFLGKRKMRNEFIADLVYGLSQTGKGNTFVLVKSIEHGKHLASLIDESVFVYGNDKSSVRKKIYEAFATNDNLVVISTYKLASTGLNIKRIFNLVMIDAGKSFTNVIQTIGRALRKAEDKDSVTVYDLYSNMKFSRRHATERKGFYREQGYPFSDNNIDYNKLYKEID